MSDIQGKDLGLVTAYAYAVEKGYTGTEEEFATLMASYASVAEDAAASAASAQESKEDAEDAATDAIAAKEAAEAAASSAASDAADADNDAVSAYSNAQAAIAAKEAAEAAQEIAESAQASATSDAARAATSANTAYQSAVQAATAKAAAETAQGKAEDAQAAAETAQGAAETAAQSVSESAEQIAANTQDVDDLKSALVYDVEEIVPAETTSAQGYYVAGTTKTLISNSAITTLEYTGDMSAPLYLTCKSFGSAAYNVITYWNASNAQISHDGVSSSTPVLYTDYELTPPTGCTTITVTGFTNDGSEIKLMTVVSQSMPKYEGRFISNDFVGHKDDELTKEYCYIPSYGQSLSVGADSLFVPDNAISGNYIIGAITNPSAALNPLSLSANGQHPIVSAINSFSTLYRKFRKPMKFVTGSYGAGGQSIAQLMSSARQAQIKSAYGYTYDIDTNNNYAVFEKSVDDTFTATSGDVSCPAIVFLQGERDYYTDEDLSTQAGATVHAYACGGDKDRYKLFMSWLKDDMQNKIMQKFGQTEKPLFCIYECSGAFVKNTTMSINMAQIEFAEENDDVILLPAPYFTPNYGSAHLSTNGYRWYGEYIAKDLFRAICQHSQNRPILPTGFWFDNNNIHIKCSGVVDKLVIDDYTVEAAGNRGFRLTVNGETNVTISSVKVCGDEIIVTTPAGLLSVTDAHLSYAGMEVQGTGNIRDNDKYIAMYDYWNDANDKGASGSLTINHRPTTKSGTSIVGEKYPMYNWLQPFYMQVK